MIRKENTSYKCKNSCLEQANVYTWLEKRNGFGSGKANDKKLKEGILQSELI